MAKSGGTQTQLPATTNDRERALIDPSRHEQFDYQQAPGTTTGSVQVQQLMGMLRRHSGLILAMTLLGALLTGLAVLFVPPQYTARAQVVVEPQQPVPGATAGTGAAAVDVLAIDTQITMLAARDHLRSVLASLAEDRSRAPGSNDRDGTGHEGSAPAIPQQLTWTNVQEFAGSAWKQLGNLVGSGHELPSFAELERTLRIDQERKARVITLRYTSQDPEFAAAVVNRVIELYAKNQTAKADAAGQTELAQLNKRVGELELQMAATEKRIRSQLDGQDAEPSGAQLRQLEREVVENAQAYDRLAQRQRQLRAEIDTRAPSFKVLYLATPPERPSSLDTKYFALPALILAMLGGGVMAIMRESLDRTQRSESQVEANLGIHCVALIPKLGWFQGRRPHEYLLKQPYSPYAEAIRYVVAALQFGDSDGKRPKVVQITSGVRDEGKTTLAVSLAVYATRMYPRTLLLDLDLRKPLVGELLKIRVDTDILNLIADKSRLEEAVHHVPSLGLDVLPLAICPIDPVTLFSNGELEKFLDYLRKKYDFIIVDSPPLLGVTETALLATLSDVVLFATKWGSTRVEVSQNALAEFRSVGWTKQVIASRVRAVVTQVELKRHAMYQYGDSVETMVKYRSSYEPYRSMKTVIPPKPTNAEDNDLSRRVAAE